MNGKPKNTEPVLPNVGELVLAPNVEPALSEAAQLFSPLLARHVSGDWSEAQERQRNTNDRTPHPGPQVASSHELKTGRTIWFITYLTYGVTMVFLDRSSVPWTQDEGGGEKR